MQSARTHVQLQEGFTASASFRKLARAKGIPGVCFLQIEPDKSWAASETWFNGVALARCLKDGDVLSILPPVPGSLARITVSRDGEEVLSLCELPAPPARVCTRACVAVWSAATAEIALHPYSFKAEIAAMLDSLRPRSFTRCAVADRPIATALPAAPALPAPAEIAVEAVVLPAPVPAPVHVAAVALPAPVETITRPRRRKAAKRRRVPVALVAKRATWNCEDHARSLGILR